MNQRSSRRWAQGIAALSLMSALACAGGTPPAAVPEVKEPASVEEPKEQSPEQRAQALVSQMTLEEKIAYLGGDRDFYIRPIERLGIPEIKLADGPVGCRNWGPSTAYPASIALASSFDPTLSHSVGTSIARDCRARGVHILLAPAVNIQRSPVNGRNFEYLGEDPLLARDASVQFIKAVQAGGVLATVKHFVANNQEWDRNHVSSEVSERALHEIYFPAFEGAVKEAKVGAVMTSYNPVNGAFASHNPYLLREILRNEWGFDGLVMSDWRAVHDTMGSVKGGTDLEMPSADYMSLEKLKPLLESGQVKEAEIDEKVENILRTLIRAGFFDREQLKEAPTDDPKSAAVALDAARKSLVLLKNAEHKGEPLLPLDAKKMKKLALVGPNVHPGVHGGSGSAYVTPVHVVSLLDGIKKAAPDLEVVHHQGIQEYTEFSFLGGAVFQGKVQQEIFAGKELKGEVIHKSEVDRIDFRPDGKSPAEGVPAENYSIRWTGQVAVDRATSMQFMTNADDGVRVLLDGKVVLDDWSDHAPRMKSAMIPMSAGNHTLVVEYFQGILGAICQFGFGPKVKPGQLHGAPELSAAMKGADAIVVAVGFGQSADTNSLGTSYPAFWPSAWARKTGIVEAEDDDRKFELPQAQVETILAATKTGKPTIVVGYSGGGVDFEPFLSKISGLFWAWYPGQEGGTAFAEALFGKLNPSAKLPVTFAKKYSDHPAAPYYTQRESLPAEEQRGAVANLKQCEGPKPKEPYPAHQVSEKELYLSAYCEDIYVGYRGFDKNETEPAFPFGFGLSYTSFEYSSFNLQVSGEGQVTARAMVKNTGERAGREIVQIYVAPQDSEQRAPQQLGAYISIELEPGETKAVELPVAARAFALYQTEEKKGWVRPEGEYELRLSSSSRQHHLRESVALSERTLTH